MDNENTNGAKKEKKGLKHFLNEGESYLGAFIFVVLTVLLTLQVITRYVFRHSFTWAEELSLAIYVPMVYASVAAAVYNRKMIRITIVTDNLPFLGKKACLILSNVLYIVFCGIIIWAYQSLIDNLGSAVTTIMRMPISIIYATIPIMHVLIAIRLIQDSVKLWKENEDELGASTKPMVDLDACEREYNERIALEKQKAGQAEPAD